MSNIVKTPSVLIVSEKHERYYFHIPDDDALFRVALDILKERFESGEWYEMEPEPKHPGFEKADIVKIPHGLKQDAEMRLLEFNEEKKEWKKSKEEIDKIEQTIKEHNGQLAWRLLLNRKEYEYERVELVEYCEMEE